MEIPVTKRGGGGESVFQSSFKKKNSINECTGEKEKIIIVRQGAAIRGWSLCGYSKKLEKIFMMGTIAQAAMMTGYH
jgi:hypothetical protein